MPLTVPKLTVPAAATPALRGAAPRPTAEELHGNIENFVGMAQVPVGLAGPLRLRGEHITEEVMVPLATTEGALVASYSRGMKAVTEAGGATVRILDEGVQRAPYFKFKDLPTAGRFVAWITTQVDHLRHLTGEVSRYARLKSVRPVLEGNSVILVFDYTTGDAAGQNMVTICTAHLCRHILKNCGERTTEFYIESNASGDKKANWQSFQRVRGKKVSIEVTLPRAVVSTVLNSTPERVEAFGRAATYGSLQSGTIGVQAHCANGLAALFIACGQDAACVAEAAVGLMRMETTAAGDLYVAGTFPNLIVGTVGGGTHLPTQRECLEIMDCAGAGKSGRLAEITAGVCLAGELSILAALTEGEFTSAHMRLGRR